MQNRSVSDTYTYAVVMKLADMQDLGSCAARRVGSTPIDRMRDPAESGKSPVLRDFHVRREHVDPSSGNTRDSFLRPARRTGCRPGVGCGLRPVKRIGREKEPYGTVFRLYEGFTVDG